MQYAVVYPPMFGLTLTDPCLALAIMISMLLWLHYKRKDVKQFGLIKESKY